MKSFLKISPIGGVGQIGSNCTLFQTPSHKILVDCGILFPRESVFDINYLIPNLSEISDVDHIIITHGHEDHIGAIIHYVKAFPHATIFAPKFAKELMLYKLEQARLVKEIQDLSSHTFEDLTIESFHVNHSIPDTKGLVVSHSELDCSITFISDFKIDRSLVYEPLFDFKKLEEQSKFSTRIALLDSTNILSKNFSTPSESSLIEPLRDLITSVSGICFITTFASNIHRIQSILNIANELGRAVIPYGRSMERYIEVALNSEFLTDPGVLKSADDTSVKRKKIVLLSGSQGEFKGALKRVISKQDSRYKLTSNDAVIFSSKPIPGNEREISIIYNEIVEQGASLYTSDRYQTHVSGHPGQNDLLEIYKTLRPTHAFPIHGESFFLREHVDFLNKNKLSSTAQMILNGDEILVTKNGIKVTNLPSVIEPVLIHGNGIEIEKTKISERRKLASLGLIVVSFSKESIVKFKPSFEVSTMGLPESLDAELPKFSKNLSEQFMNVKNLPIDDKKEKLRIFTRKYFEHLLGYRPIAIIHFC